MLLVKCKVRERGGGKRGGGIRGEGEMAAIRLLKLAPTRFEVLVLNGQGDFVYFKNHAVLCFRQVGFSGNETIRLRGRLD